MNYLKQTSERFLEKISEKKFSYFLCRSGFLALVQSFIQLDNSGDSSLSISADITTLVGIGPSLFKMQDFTIGDLGVFIGTIGGVVTSILVIIQKSRCVKIDFCGCHCVRDINELKKESIHHCETLSPNLCS